jgi:hypothetical protein
MQISTRIPFSGLVVTHFNKPAHCAGGDMGAGGRSNKINAPPFWRATRPQFETQKQNTSNQKLIEKQQSDHPRRKTGSDGFFTLMLCTPQVECGHTMNPPETPACRFRQGLACR